VDALLYQHEFTIPKVCSKYFIEEWIHEYGIWKLASHMSWYVNDFPTGREATCRVLENARLINASESKNLPFYINLSVEQVRKIERDLSFIPLIIINVDAPEFLLRWNKSKLEAIGGGWTHIERFNALRGCQINESELTQWLTPKAKERLSSKTVKHEEWMPSYNAVALARNHWHIIQDTYLNRKQFSRIAIAEDDFTFTELWHQRGLEFVNHLPDDDTYDIALFGYFLKHQTEMGEMVNDHWCKLTKQSIWAGLHFYIVTRRGMNKLIEHTFPLELQLDVHWSHLMNNTECNLTVIVPTHGRDLAVQRYEDCSSLQIKINKK